MKVNNFLNNFSLLLMLSIHLVKSWMKEFVKQNEEESLANVFVEVGRNAKD